MNPHFEVRHETRYHYPEAVPHAQSEARVQPRDMPWQKLIAESVEIVPVAADRRERLDFFGNRVQYFSIQEPHTESAVNAHFTVELLPDQRPVAAQSNTLWAEIPERLQAPELLDIRPWAHPSPRIPQSAAIAAYAGEVFSQEAGLIPACQRFMTRVFTEFRYDPDSTDVTTAVEKAFKLRAGVCQDFAHVMLCGLRGLGLPCRYVSGYLETLPPPGQEKLVGADATHAWISVYDPAIGWVDFDPTNNLLPYNQHITLGWGRDFTDVIPVKGVVTGGNQQEITVRVDVRNVTQV